MATLRHLTWTLCKDSRKTQVDFISSNSTVLFVRDCNWDMICIVLFTFWHGAVFCKFRATTISYLLSYKKWTLDWFTLYSQLYLISIYRKKLHINDKFFSSLWSILDRFVGAFGMYELRVIGVWFVLRRLLVHPTGYISDHNHLIDDLIWWGSAQVT